MKTIHIYLFGLGNVGSTFIDQILESQSYFKNHHQLVLKIVGLANSRRVYTISDGIGRNWLEVFKKDSRTRENDAFYKFAQYYDVPRIAVDATASAALSLFYPELLQHGFHIATANKIANTLSQDFYDQLRVLLKKNELQFKYETNVGAGLPIVKTIHDLVHSGEQIYQVNGVFSGSLGYIFNRFSQEDQPFSTIVLDALKYGYTEPDPREDLSGNDVARKLLVLAREAGLQLEWNDIAIETLVPENLNASDINHFINNIEQLDTYFEELKNQLNPNEVWRHLGQLNLKEKTLKVSLQIVDADSPAGQLQGSDGFFEIYSQSYATHPLIIKGAGAGKEVTARGLLGDVVQIAKTAHQVALIPS